MFFACLEVYLRILDPYSEVSAKLGLDRFLLFVYYCCPRSMSGSPTRLAIAANFSINELACCKSPPPALPDDS